jgi:hypothetical protein
MGNAIMARKRASSLEPKSFVEAVKFAEQISGTSFVPDHFRGKPADILAAMQFGSEVGIGPLQSLNGLAVINGRVTMYANTMRALVEASGLMEKCSVTYEPAPPLAKVVVRRVGREDETYTFGLDDAKAAGLAGRQMYAKYPKRMYVARAMSFAMRDEFSDVLKGVMGAEEMDEKGEVITESEDFSGTPVVSAAKTVDMQVYDLMKQLDEEFKLNIYKGFNALEYSDTQQLVALKAYQLEEDGGAALYEHLRDEYRQRLSVKLSAELLDHEEDADAN